LNKYAKRFKNNLKYIKDYYIYLVELTDNHQNIGITNEWIIDNYATILERNNLVMEILSDKELLKQLEKTKDKLYNLLTNTIENQNYKVTEKSLIRAINNYQNEKRNYLGYREITLLKPLFIMIVIEKMKELCTKEKEKLDIILKVDYQISKLEKNLSKSDAIKQLKIKDNITINPTYIERINYHLTRIGSPLNDVFYKLNEIIEDNNLTLRKIINKAQDSNIKANILISNLFNLLKMIEILETETLYEEISKTEEELNKDKIYKKMDVITKNMYRSKIFKIRKIKKNR